MQAGNSKVSINSRQNQLAQSGRPSFLNPGGLNVPVEVEAGAHIHCPKRAVIAYSGTVGQNWGDDRLLPSSQPLVIPHLGLALSAHATS